MKEAADSFNISDMTEIQKMLSSTTQTMSLLLGSIAAISLVVGGIGIMNIMLQFLVESVGLTISGGFIGIIPGIGISLILSFFAGWAVITSPLSVVLATSFSALTGIFFGIWPEKKTAALKPVEALRYE